MKTLTKLALLTSLSLSVNAMADSLNLTVGSTVEGDEAFQLEVGGQDGYWEANVGLFGKDKTDMNLSASFSFVNDTPLDVIGADFYYRMGVIVLPDHETLDVVSLRLGTGFDFGKVAVEAFHYSNPIKDDSFQSGVLGASLKFKL